MEREEGGRGEQMATGLVSIEVMTGQARHRLCIAAVVVQHSLIKRHPLLQLRVWVCGCVGVWMCECVSVSV